MKLVISKYVTQILFQMYASNQQILNRKKLIRPTTILLKITNKNSMIT